MVKRIPISLIVVALIISLSLAHLPQLAQVLARI
jgi:hypothetical protein